MTSAQSPLQSEAESANLIPNEVTRLIDQAKRIGVGLHIVEPYAGAPLHEFGLKLYKPDGPIDPAFKVKLAQLKLNVLWYLRYFEGCNEAQQWAITWQDAVSELGPWKSNSWGAASTVAFYLVIDAAASVYERGLDAYPEDLEKLRSKLQGEEPDAARRTFIRKWFDLYLEEERLRGSGDWWREDSSKIEYGGLSEKAKNIWEQQARWAHLLVYTDRLSGSWPWVDPTRWAAILEPLVRSQRVG